jgi:excisionase family DNA binding protein
MSIKNDPVRQRRSHARRSIAPICFTVSEWVSATGLSKPSVYRMMQDGRLRFVQFGRTRRIPATEQARLGLTENGGNAA